MKNFQKAAFYVLIDPTHIYSLTNQKVLGLNPPVFDFAWFDLWSKPAGLLNMLGFLKSLGNQVQLLDCLYEAREKPLTCGRWKVRREEVRKPDVYSHIPRRYYRFGLGPDQLRAKLAEYDQPDIILITSIMTYWYPGVFEAIRTLKEVFPKIPIALGGIYASLCPDHARQSGADHLLITPTPHRVPITPLELYNQPEYGILATSHGCPLRCQYCASSILHPGFQPRPLEEICADLDHQMSLGPTDLAFYDDALLWEPEKRFYPLCAYIKEKYPQLRLHTPNGLSVAMLDERCCRALYGAGFQTLRLSLEGTDPYTSSVGSGKTGPQNYTKAVNNLMAAGYKPEDVETYILAGLPGQKIEDIERSIHFVKSLGGRPKLCEFSPIPGTRLYTQALKDHPELGHDPLRHNNTVYTSHLSGRISPKILQELKTLCKCWPQGPGLGILFT